jgi:hypothetical protein
MNSLKSLDWLHILNSAPNLIVAQEQNSGASNVEKLLNVVLGIAGSLPAVQQSTAVQFIPAIIGIVNAVHAALKQTGGLTQPSELAHQSESQEGAG